MRTSCGTLLALLLAACVARPEPRGAVGRLYRLPYEGGTSRPVVQEGPGPFSHTGDQEHAVDFEMPEGTPVLAARAGRVVRVKEDSDRGGPSEDMAPHGNEVVIEHADSTRATYLHLRQGGALVEVGQHVLQGQVIAYSGNTGWSLMPHLHFQVDRQDAQTGRWRSIPVAFEEVPGDGVPRMLRFYVSGNVPAGEDAARLLAVPPPQTRGAFR